MYVVGKTKWGQGENCKPEDRHVSIAAVSPNDRLKIQELPSHLLWTRSNKGQRNGTK